MRTRRQIRCPVFGFTELSWDEGKLIDLPVFQRLRGIKQLALANLVYPGALHTRFDHSLGVCHLAHLMYDALVKSGSLTRVQEEEECVGLAALLHDIGHGPFSHVSEALLERYAGTTTPSSQPHTQIHELVTRQIIDQNKGIEKTLGNQRKDFVIGILSGTEGDPLLKHIVTGPLDADKQDYLLRDSHFCGVPYGSFDVKQLHRSLRAISREHGYRELALSADGVHTFEQYAMAKYFLTRQVYAHRVRVSTDLMLSRAVSLGIDTDNLEEMRDVFGFDGTPEFLERFLRWNDNRFLNAFTEARFNGTHSHDILTRLVRRRLFKRIFREKITAAAFPDIGRERLPRITGRGMEDTRKALETEVARLLQSTKYGKHVIPEYVIIHTYSIKTIKEQARNDERAVMVDKRPRPALLESESVLLNSINEEMSEQWIEIYAPVLYADQRERARFLNSTHQDIVQILSTLSQDKE